MYMAKQVWQDFLALEKPVHLLDHKQERNHPKMNASIQHGIASLLLHHLQHSEKLLPHSSHDFKQEEEVPQAQQHISCLLPLPKGSKKLSIYQMTKRRAGGMMSPLTLRSMSSMELGSMASPTSLGAWMVIYWS